MPNQLPCYLNFHDIDNKWASFFASARCMNVNQQVVSGTSVRVSISNDALHDRADVPTDASKDSAWTYDVLLDLHRKTLNMPIPTLTL